jgi:hypothetical protein
MYNGELNPHLPPFCCIVSKKQFSPQLQLIFHLISYPLRQYKHSDSFSIVLIFL